MGYTHIGFSFPFANIPHTFCLRHFLLTQDGKMEEEVKALSELSLRANYRNIDHRTIYANKEPRKYLLGAK